MEILQIKDGTPVDSRMDSQMGERWVKDLR